MKNTHITHILKELPKNPGVYQYFDAFGKLIYVGKAKSLKNRVSSYFNKDSYDSGKTRLLVKQIRDIKFIIVETEFDALLLENSLIKEHQPKFNIQLRDDKTYPWICIKNERFPRVFSTRNIIKDGSLYFGPYASVKAMKAVLELVRTTYKVRTCNLNLTPENIEADKFKVCLEYHLGNCKAPCVGQQQEADYNNNIEEIKNIVKGNINSVIRAQKELMAHAAENLEFEKAQQIKERLELLEKYQSKSTVVNPSIHDVDVFGMVNDVDYVYINYLKIANGSIIQSHTVEIKNKYNEAPEDILALAVADIRNTFNSTSKELYLPLELNLEIPNVSVHIPKIGDKKRLLDLSVRNALYHLNERKKNLEKTDPERHTKRILQQLQQDLRLKELPIHIECFDNSNFQGSFPVSACVVFKNAKPAKKDYRHFNIKTVEGPNDFASMEEVVYRRYSRLVNEGESLPQLIIIDGGKGQLGAALSSLEKLGLRGKIPIIGIAKKLEEIFFPGDSLPLYIDKRSESLKLIQKLRNEAHRFGITFHRNKRSKGTIKSELTSVPGIGEATLNKLLQHFKSVKRIKEATLEDLQQVVDLKKAQAIQQHFKV